MFANHSLTPRLQAVGRLKISELNQNVIARKCVQTGEYARQIRLLPDWQAEIRNKNQIDFLPATKIPKLYFTTKKYHKIEEYLHSNEEIKSLSVD